MVTQYGLHFMIGSTLEGFLVSYVILSLQFLGFGALLGWILPTAGTSIQFAWTIIGGVFLLVLGISTFVLSLVWYRYKKDRAAEQLLNPSQRINSGQPH